MDDLVTHENLSRDLLCEIYDSFGMSAAVDDEGDLRVSDGGIKCYVFPRAKHVKLMSIFEAEPKADHSDLLELANRINLEYIIVRVVISEKGSIYFETTIPVEGGITEEAIVLATRQFLGIPVQAIVEHGDRLVKW